MVATVPIRLLETRRFLDRIDGVPVESEVLVSREGGPSDRSLTALGAGRAAGRASGTRSRRSKLI